MCYFSPPSSTSSSPTKNLYLIRSTSPHPHTPLHNKTTTNDARTVVLEMHHNWVQFLIPLTLDCVELKCNLIFFFFVSQDHLCSVTFLTLPSPPPTSGTVCTALPPPSLCGPKPSRTKRKSERWKGKEREPGRGSENERESSEKKIAKRTIEKGWVFFFFLSITQIVG